MLLKFLSDRLSLYEPSVRLLPQLNDFQVLESIIYIIIYEKKKKPSLLYGSFKLSKDYWLAMTVTLFIEFIWKKMKIYFELKI